MPTHPFNIIFFDPNETLQRLKIRVLGLPVLRCTRRRALPEYLPQYWTFTYMYILSYNYTQQYKVQQYFLSIALCTLIARIGIY